MTKRKPQAHRIVPGTQLTACCAKAGYELPDDDLIVAQPVKTTCRPGKVIA